MSDLNFKYIFDNEYNPKYVNGAYGGVGPQGEVVINFYFERGAMPKKICQEVDNNGKLGELKYTEPDNIEKTFIRYVQSGIIVDNKHARDIYNLLGRILGEINE